MEHIEIEIHRDKRVAPEELLRLLAAVGWADGADPAAVRRSIERYPFVAHARRDDGSLVGYVSAFSDGAFSVLIGELVVHPELQRRGIGSRLLRAVEARYAGLAVYVTTFADQQPFFERHGYAMPRRGSASF